MAGTKRGLQAAGVERREALVRAAFQGIVEHGIGGLRLRAVAAAAGIDHTTIHHYFPGKQDLITAVADYATAQLRATPADGDPAERLREHLHTQGAKITENPELFVVLRELDLRAMRDPEVAELVASREAGWRKSLITLIEEAQAAPDTPATTTADLIIGAVKGASLNPATADAVLRSLALRLAG
ncbi:TetR/AcrR family transcriptional regulator [Streptomyces sp. SID13031]|uniref:TetR/AcrR family transcriptional regulator n=1 Tax=Streptomyces sp. SID13031 TaxID=2706046 RepID=UPI0013C8D11E|nr:TetR/AcrR family transcriptional regulator [Streptomyces sp. SID13031]NEA35700.1 TetR/AcrR family transcriptional regulator [Streptomyces sp. SID13031]